MIQTKAVDQCNDFFLLLWLSPHLIEPCGAVELPSTLASRVVCQEGTPHSASGCMSLHRSSPFSRLGMVLPGNVHFPVAIFSQFLDDCVAYSISSVAETRDRALSFF